MVGGAMLLAPTVKPARPLDEWPEGTAGVLRSAYQVGKRRDHNQEADHGYQHDVLSAWHGENLRGVEVHHTGDGAIRLFKAAQTADRSKSPRIDRHRRSKRRCATVREMKEGPLEFGDQVADPKPPRAAVVKSHGGERCGNAGTMIPAGTVERGERKRTVSEVSKAD
jgi:hypothetical protein